MDLDLNHRHESPQKKGLSSLLLLLTQVLDHLFQLFLSPWELPCLLIRQAWVQMLSLTPRVHQVAKVRAHRPEDDDDDDGIQVPVMIQGPQPHRRGETLDYRLPSRMGQRFLLSQEANQGDQSKSFLLLFLQDRIFILRSLKHNLLSYFNNPRRTLHHPSFLGL